MARKACERAAVSWPEEDHRREKLLKYGVHTLRNAGLLAVFRRTGVRRSSAVNLGRELLHRFTTLRAISAGGPPGEVRYLNALGVRDVIGQPVGAILPDISDLLAPVKDDADAPMEYCLGDGANARHFDLRISPLRERGGSVAAHIVVLREITRRKQLEEERVRLIDKLQKALAEVKTLSGLLPICAHCKSIRDDQGYWHSVEATSRSARTRSSVMASAPTA